MLWSSIVPPVIFRKILASTFLSLAICFLVSFFPARSRTQAQAQAYEKELTVGGKVLLTVRNRNGRVSVIASDDEKSKATLRATSANKEVEPGDITVSGGEITVRERPNRIDLVVRVPKR